MVFYLSEVALRRIVNRALFSRHHLATTHSAQGLNIMQEVRDQELQKTVDEFDLQIQEWYVVNSFLHLLHLLISLPIPISTPPPPPPFSDRIALDGAALDIERAK